MTRLTASVSNFVSMVYLTDKAPLLSICVLVYTCEQSGAARALEKL